MRFSMRYHPCSNYAKFSKNLTFFTPLYAHAPGIPGIIKGN